MSADAFKIEVTVYGPEYTRDTGYGPRQERDRLASFDVPVDPFIVWDIFQEVVTKATAPRIEVVP